MKSYEQLMQHYWGKIVPMAEAAGINPWECVKYNAPVYIVNHPDFSGVPEKYTFALTVLEGKPVFVGDEFYSSTGTKFKIREFTDKFNFEGCTWTPPTKKRTFMLNDNELNCPINDTNGCRLDFLGVDYYFNSVQDRNEVAIAINNMLHTARDKE